MNSSEMNTSEFEAFTEEPLNYNGTNKTDSYAIGATIASPITMAMAGVVGNLLALVVLHKTKTEIRRMMFYTLVAALACTDLAGILLTTPVTVAAYINRREMPGGIGLCKFNAFIMVCFGLATPLIVCAMAVERFLAIKCTYFYSKHCTPHNARITVVVLWAFVFFFGALPLFGFGDFSLQFPNTWCFLNFRTTDLVFSIYGYMYAGLNLGIVVLMTCCNVFVMITLMRARYIKRQQGRNSISNSLLRDSFNEKHHSQSKLKKKNQNDVEMQMIWLMSTITTVFAVCWAPLMIHIILTLATQRSNPVLGLLAIRLASLNQTLDPWLYILLRKAFLKKVLKTTKKIFRSRPTPTPEAQKYKRNRYVHVRRQLCHRNLYVGNTDSNNVPSRSGSDEQKSRSNVYKSQNGRGSLPDVMKTTSSGKSDPLPDVAISNRSGFIPQWTSDNERSTTVHHDPNDEVYVDLFQLLPNVEDSSNTDERALSNVDVVPDQIVSKDHCSEGFQPHECYSSADFIFAPNVPNETVSDRNPHSDVTPVRGSGNKTNVRRTNSFT